MDPRRSAASFLVAVVAVFALVFPLSAFAADVVTVGTVTASGNTVDVPIYILDASGTPLGGDRPAGSRIQSLSIKVDYSPSAAIQSVTFERAGVTANLNPTSEFKPSSPGSTSLLVTFQESTNPIPLGLNAPAPGDLVAHLVFTLSSNATPGSSINLTLDSNLTQLTDSGGTAATKETTANGELALVDGRIDIPTLSVSLLPSNRDVPLGGTAMLTVVLSANAPGDTVVNLTSSNPGVATVPSSVIVPAGTSFVAFQVTGVTLGSSNITASLGSSSSVATVNVVEPQPGPCEVPDAPRLSAPVTAEIGVPYSVTWPAVPGATDYVIQESTSASFATFTSQSVTGTSATFTHDIGNIRYYYRARARLREGACDTLSSISSTVSVLINTAPAAPARR